MPPEKRKSANVKKLAKSVRANQTRARSRRARKDSVRSEHGSDAGRALDDERNIPAISRLMQALQEEGIRFQVIGMSAAILHGVPGSTQDVDIWIDLPSREYMRPVKLAMKQGAEFVRNTVVALSDHVLVNFVYEVTGLGAFNTEYPKSKKLPFYGMRVSVLSLESIEKSKRAIGRPKDLIHLQQIKDLRSCQVAEKRAKKGAK